MSEVSHDAHEKHDFKEVARLREEPVTQEAQEFAIFGTSPTSTMSRATQEIVHHAEGTLRDVAPLPFSENAFSTLKNNIADYISELVRESKKVSKRRQSDIVSRADVDRANEYLVTNTGRRLFRHLGAVGGIFFGAAISNVLTMVTTATYSTSGVLLSLGLGFLGAFMVAFYIAKD